MQSITMQKTLATPVLDPPFNQSHSLAEPLQLLNRLWSGEVPEWVSPVGFGPEIPAALTHLRGHSESAVSSVLCSQSSPLPEATVNWGSGGQNARHSSPEIDRFFEQLFLSLHQETGPAGSQPELKKEDLFHAHLFSIPAQEGSLCPDQGEIGVLFHAKEYPQDIEPAKGKHSGFTTDSANYRNRNFLYLLSQNRHFLLQPTMGTGGAETVGPGEPLLQGFSSWQALEPGLREEIRANYGMPPYQKAWAVSADKFYSLGHRLPDVNYLSTHLNSEDRVVFFKPFDIKPGTKALPG